MMDGGAGSESEYDCVVLGAGITGLVSAAILSKQDAGRILVLDQYGHLGGNHIDRAYGAYTFDIGSFIFQDDSPLLAHFPELLPLYVPIEPTFGRLTPQGRVADYPISIRDDLLRAGPVELSRILISVGVARLFHRKISHARAFARHWIGDRLLRRSGLENYMHRFYGVPADRIDAQFAQARMQWIKKNAMVRTHVQKVLRGGPSEPINRQLARPKEGFGALYGVAKDVLAARGVEFLLSADLKAINRQGDRFLLDTRSRTIATRRLVSTMPIPDVQSLCGMTVAAELPTVTMTTLFFSHQGKRGFPQAVLFNFSDQGAWKRLTMHSDFYGLASGREYFCVEVNSQAKSQNEEAAAADFAQHVRAHGLFAGDLKLEGTHVLDNAYPVYVDQTAAKAAEAVRSLREFGIESFGRQGGFDYLPTARSATIIAERALANVSRSPAA